MNILSLLCWLRRWRGDWSAMAWPFGRLKLRRRVWRGHGLLSRNEHGCDESGHNFPKIALTGFICAA